MNIRDKIKLMHKNFFDLSESMASSAVQFELMGDIPKARYYAGRSKAYRDAVAVLEIQFAEVLK